MIALDGIDILADIHLRRDQPDIADVMLRAGVMAAGDVDVERRVDVDARFAPVADLGGMALVLNAANRQPALPVQAISPARICEAPTASPIFLIAAIASSTFPSATPGIRSSARPSAGYRRRRGPARSLPAAHLIAGDFPAQRYADPVQSRLLLLVRRYAPCGRTPAAAARFRHAGEGFAEPLLDQREKLVVPMPSSTYFSRALLRLVRSPRSMKTRTTSDTLVASAGLTMMSPYLQNPVPGDAAEPEAKPDAGLGAKAVLHLDRGERDVVGVFQHRDLAGAVEGDVELARQPVQRAIVEDMVVPLPRIFAGIQQLLRIDPGRRRARDVADVVGAGAARAQPRSWMPSISATAFFGGISRTCSSPAW